MLVSFISAFADGGKNTGEFSQVDYSVHLKYMDASIFVRKSDIPGVVAAVAATPNWGENELDW